MYNVTRNYAATETVHNVDRFQMCQVAKRRETSDTDKKKAYLEVFYDKIKPQVPAHVCPVFVF